MQIINITVGQPNQTIKLGRRGENEVTKVVFDVSYFVETFGEGSAVLFAKRSNDTEAYPVAITTNENEVTWIVNNADTQYVGQGKAELFWYIDEQLAKSEVYLTWTDKDIGASSSTPPEPQQAWTEQLIEDINELLDEAESAMDGKLSQADTKVAAASGYADNAASSAQAAAASAAEANTILATTVYVGTDGNFYIRGE